MLFYMKILISYVLTYETGKIVPCFNTLLELTRILDYDILMVHRSLVPTAQSLISDSFDNRELVIFLQSRS